MRIIIMAGGESKRWNNYKGSPKHFVSIGGECLIYRTITQVKEYGEVVVVTPPLNEIDSIWEAFIKTCDMVDCIQSKRIGTASLYELYYTKIWDSKSRNIVLLGDVYFTDEAIDKIINHNEDNYTFIGREGKSKATGLKYGELWGLSFLPSSIQFITYNMGRVRDLYQNKVISRCTGWEIYKLLQGIPFGTHSIKGNFLEINDLTEDFDTPQDYEDWIKVYENIPTK